MPHGVLPTHALHGIGVINAFHIQENAFDETFEHVKDVLLFDEAHFAIYLREFRLTIGAEVFVAETFHDLVVSVVSAHHQQLLERLRRLGQCIELACVHTGRDDEVTCPFRGGLDQKRRLYVHEMMLMEVVSGRTVDGVPQFDIPLQDIPAQVQIAIAHPEIVAAVGIVLDREWRDGGTVQNPESLHADFDIPRMDIWIPVAAFHNGAGHLNDKLPAQGLLIKLCRKAFCEDELCDPVTVPQVYKSDRAEFPDRLHPTGKGRILSGMGYPEFAAGVFSVHMFRH